MNMQRWIAASLALMLVLAGGLGTAYWFYKQNRPQPLWVPLKINPESTEANRNETIAQLTQALQDRKILAAISRDTGAAAKWKLASDEQAAEEIARRMFVRMGEVDTPMGKTPTIDVGLNGKVKDKDLTSAMVTRMMDDVARILGLNPPAKEK